MYNILVIDDDEIYLKSIQNLLEYKNFKVTTCENPLNVLRLLKENSFQCVMLDVRMPGKDGLDVLDQIKKHDPQIPVIMVSGQSTISIAVEALQKDAYDFIEKPVNADRLLVTLKNALEKYTLQTSQSALISQIQEQYQIVGESKAIKSILQQIQKIAPTSAKVLIRGATGTGKELVARALHNLSDRSGRPYLKINCAAIPENLLESELFGHVKGAFTGAFEDKTGVFEAANGGTLFLDEIGELDQRFQAKLLQVLQDGSFSPVGSTKEIQVDVRIIAATNQNLENMIDEKRFRSDLYHRLNVVEIFIPALDKRKDDIPDLANYFLSIYTKTYNKKITHFSEQALLYLSKQSFKGNIRELKHLIEKVIIFCESSIIELGDVKKAFESEPVSGYEPFSFESLKDELLKHEKEYIEMTLKIANGRKSKAAEILNINRSALFKKIRKFGIE